MLIPNTSSPFRPRAVPHSPPHSRKAHTPNKSSDTYFGHGSHVENSGDNYLNPDAFSLETDRVRPEATQRPLPENLEEYLANRQKRVIQQAQPEESGIAWFNTVFLPIMIVAVIFVVSGFIFNKMRSESTEEFDLETHSGQAVDFQTDKGKINSYETTSMAPAEEAASARSYVAPTANDTASSDSFAPSFIITKNASTELNGIAVSSPREFLKYSVINGVKGNGESSRISLNGYVYGKYDIVDENLGLYFIGVVADQQKAYFKDMSGKVYAMRY